jgi:hypothetical protein
MSQPGVIASTFIHALTAAEVLRAPFLHWTLRDALPAGVPPAVSRLPLAPPPSDTNGRRDTQNTARSYCGVVNRRRFQVCDGLAQAFQSARLVRTVERLCGVKLSGTFLRIECCQDTDGFWLEPHTDIGAKLFTLLIYLSDDPYSSSWGTDLYDEDLNFAGRAPYGRNRGLAFVPGNNTWHGFEPREIRGVRRSLIVNYVSKDWRSRHELAFPETPVLASETSGQGRSCGARCDASPRRMRTRADASGRRHP